jgi:rod shape-determining protein MreD
VLWVLPLLVGSAIVQSIALPGTTLLGVRPDLVLVIVVGWAVLRGWEEGLVVGLIGGFMTDLTAATPFGINLVRLGVVGAASGLAMQRLARQGPVIPLGAAAFGTVLGFAITVLGMQATRWALPWEYALVYQTLPVAALNTVIMAIAFPGLRALSRRGVPPEEVGA